MNKFEDRLQEIKSRKTVGLMTHVVIGYPTLEETVKVVKVMAESGVDFIELQIPFSDPLADGPTIMRACEEALRKGVKVRDAFKIASYLSKQIEVPLLFMAYYNTVFKYGTKKFCQDAKKVGISGLIVPDIPLEEEHQEHFIEYCKRYGLYNIRVVSPISTLERIRKNAVIANGFIYCTARQGITGAQKYLNPNLIAYLKKIKHLSNMPIAVGFGISNKEHLEMLAPHADIVVVGSALIDVINKSKRGNLEDDVRQFIHCLS